MDPATLLFMREPRSCQPVQEGVSAVHEPKLLPCLFSDYILYSSHKTKYGSLETGSGNFLDRFRFRCCLIHVHASRSPTIVLIGRGLEKA